MSGTLEGGRKAALKNKEKYGEDFYKVQGAKGGKSGNTGGFYHMKYTKGNFEAIKAAGAKGGTISRRTGIPNKPKPVKHWYDFLRRTV